MSRVSPWRRLKPAGGWRLPLFTVGVLLTAAAVFVIRNPGAVPAPLHSRLVADLSALPRLCFPRTTLLACVLGLLGMAAQAIAGAGAVPRNAASSKPLIAPGRWTATGWLSALFCVFAMLAWLESSNNLDLPGAGASWLIVMASGLLCAFALDRRNGVELGWDLGRGEWAFLVLAVVGGAAYWLHDVDSWRYSLIGDEYGFFHWAQQRADLPWSRWNILEAKGNFKVNPQMTSVIQGLSIAAFGPSVRAWTGGTVALMLLPLPALYWYVRTYAGIGGAVIACAVYVGSPVLIAHGKIGYPNGMMLMPILLTLCWADLASRRGSTLYAFLAGASAGFGIFLVGIGFLIATAYLAAILGVELLATRDRRAVATKIATVFVGWLLAAFPIFIQWDFFEEILRHESGRNRQVASYLVTNTIGSFGAFLSYCDGRSHFLAGQALDGFSAVLVLVGAVWTALSRNWRVPLLLVLTVGLGLSGSGQRFIPFTRVLVLVVPWALFAGFGGAWILRCLSGQSTRAVAVAAMVVGIAIASWSNAYNDSDRVLSEVHFVTYFMQEIAPEKRAIFITNKNLQGINDGAFERTEVDAVAVYPDDSIDALDALLRLRNADPQSDIVAFVDRAIALPEAAAALIVDHRIPAFVPARTVLSRVDDHLTPLTEAQVIERAH